MLRALSLTMLLTMWALPALAASPPKAGDTAPAFTLPETDGKPLTLGSLHGKPVYLNFFATWCGPCNEEAPTIAKLQRAYAAKGLVVVGIDEQENAAKAKEFSKKYSLPYPVVVDGGTVYDAYGVLALPVHVFVDRNGRVKLYRLGEMSNAEIEAAVKSIL